MADSLVVLRPASDDPSRSELAAIGFGQQVAAQLGGACDVLLLGPEARAASGQVAGCGVRRVHVADHPELADPTGEAHAAAVAHVAGEHTYRLIAAPASTMARDFVPRAAARLSAPMASDVVKLGDCDASVLRFTKPCFSGNLLADIELHGETALATCRASAFEPAAGDGSAGEVVTVSLPEKLAHARKRYVEMQRTPLERPELTEAEIVVSGGRGTKGDFGVLEELADVLGAAIGASRAVVDAGWMPNDFQVGQTGKVIAPKVYIGCGLSGAIQHLAGMRNSKVIVAINKDPNAPIFEVADYGLVADLFEAVPTLTSAFRAAREKQGAAS